MKQASHRNINTLGVHLREVPRAVKVIGTKSRLVAAARAGEEENEGLLFNETRFSVWEDKKGAGVLGTDGCEGCRTV